MPIFEFEVAKKNLFDESILADVRHLGVTRINSVEKTRKIIIQADLTSNEADDISRVLADPVTEIISYGVTGEREPILNESHGFRVKEVIPNLGVMDSWEASVLKILSDLGIYKSAGVRTSHVYRFGGGSKRDVDKAVYKLLANPVIEHVRQPGEGLFIEAAPYQLKIVRIPLRRASGKMLDKISHNRLWLNTKEMRKIQQYYKRLGRDPTDIELETFAQTWGEHCVHKTFKGNVDFSWETTDGMMAKQNIRGIMNYITRPAKELNLDWLLSVFHDNSGVIAFDSEYGVCFKVETHNHPSALDPYGGSATGIGGVIRDPMGTGLGAKPVANTDIFCFGPPDYPHKDLPKGVLHPRRIAKGVHAGVRDYGNRMGIPTVNGAILFDKRYITNPLVYCGTVGLIPRNMVTKRVEPGYLAIAVGGRTGRDGIHGSTFSSGVLTHESETVSSGAVQIGNPITEKKMNDISLKARDLELYEALTDFGGGGASSAVGEMGAETGVEVNLENFPLKYAGLNYTEIWISEAQERMLYAVRPEKAVEFINYMASEDVEASVIGKFTGDNRLTLKYNNTVVGDLPMEFLHHGVPERNIKAVWKRPHHEEPDLPERDDYTDDLLDILGSWNVCSKEHFVRQYDHEVQGGTVLKPMVGVANDGPGDASIILPRLGSNRGLVISCGINPKYGDVDPYWMAVSAIDEALRNLIAVGGNLDRVALLDNFCWGDPNKPDRMGALVRAAQGCYYGAMGFKTPFVSGKDSLNNEFKVSETETICIPHTLLVSAIGVMPDVRRAVSMDAKEPGNYIYMVGMTRPELGGSHYYGMNGFIGNDVPKVSRIKERKELMQRLSRTIYDGRVRACHDCSEGGLAVAAAEMAFAGGLGMDLDLNSVPYKGEKRDDNILFAESNTRWLVEVRPEKHRSFERAMDGYPVARIGETTASGYFHVKGLYREPVIISDIDELKEAWQAPLRW